MKLTQEETMFIKNLKAQEDLCVDKYKFYAGEAKDEELKKLFNRIEKSEKRHADMLDELMDGKIPEATGKKAEAEDYEPKGCAAKERSASGKKHDQFLCTDSITTEKYVASAYNNDLFHFASTDVRNVLNDIQTEEQNHAEMIYKYKAANDMM